VERVKEKNFFFRLSKYGPALLEHYDRHPHFVLPSARQNEMRRLIEGGLEDISVSRAGQAWGIPLPFDPKSVVYVWYDALINYIAAVGYGGDDALFERWWPAGLHLVGKDITRFHCVVWPAMLMSVGLELPKQVFGHGWVLFKGEKMSKSLGNVVDCSEIADTVGGEALRLFCVSHHFRSPVEFDFEATRDAAGRVIGARFHSLEAADKKLEYFYTTLKRIDDFLGQAGAGEPAAGPVMPEADKLVPDARAALADDFNTPVVMAALHDAAALANRLLDEGKGIDKQLRRRTLARIARDMRSVGDAIGVFAADSSAATWKFNAAKSKSTSTNPIKSQTDVRETTPDGGVSVTRTGQFKDGAPNEGTYSYKYDGKESSVAATGLPFDKISVKRKDANTTSWEVKKTGGRYHQTGQNVISKDGKMLTQSFKGTDTDGKPVRGTNVFERQ
jgi:methionyl-tRNA synthetase